MGLGEHLLRFRRGSARGAGPGRRPALPTHRLAPPAPGTAGPGALPGGRRSTGPGRGEDGVAAPGSGAPGPRDRGGLRPHRGLRPARPPALPGSSLCGRGVTDGPRPGAWAAATRCQTRGAQSHIPRRWPRPPSTRTLLPTSGNAALYAHLPPPFSSPERPRLWGREDGACAALATEAPLPAVPRGWLQSVPLTPWVSLLLKLPSKMVWGPGPSLSLLPSFYLCFCLQIGVGSSTGPGQRSPTPGVTRRGFWLEPVCRVGLDFPSPHQGPHCEVITALNPLLFYLLNLI